MTLRPALAAKVRLIVWLQEPRSGSPPERDAIRRWH